MTIVDSNTLKTYLRVNRSDDVPEDDLIEAVCAAAEQHMVDACGNGRSFTPATAGDTATARIFGSDALTRDGKVLRIDDCIDVTAVVGASTAAASDYQELSLNGRRRGQVWPFEQIEHATRWVGEGVFHTFTVTAKWGWPTATPTRVTEAIKVLAKDMLGQRELRMGYINFAEAGIAAARRNPFVLGVIDDYSRVEKLGIG